jgi:hypothetical protein
MSALFGPSQHFFPEEHLRPTIGFTGPSTGGMFGLLGELLTGKVLIGEGEEIIPGEDLKIGRTSLSRISNHSLLSVVKFG